MVIFTLFFSYDKSKVGRTMKNRENVGLVNMKVDETLLGINRTYEDLTKLHQGAELNLNFYCCNGYIPTVL